MNNITYTIVESSSGDNSSNNSWSDISLNVSTDSNVLADVKRTLQNDEKNIACNEFMARQIDYELNYNNKYLVQILEFYGLKKNKLNKKDIILKIVEFEIDKENSNIVENRKRLFDNFIELKNNTFFSRFIIGN